MKKLSNCCQVENRGKRSKRDPGWTSKLLESMRTGQTPSGTTTGMSMRVVQVCHSKYEKVVVVCVCACARALPRLYSRVTAYNLTCTWDSVDSSFCLASSRDSEALFCLAASSRI
jgi:hypothetical protein